MVNTTVAQEIADRRVRHHEQNGYAIDYREAEPIVFMERGVEFMVFPNGDFDFNTHNNSYNQPPRGYYGRRGAENDTQYTNTDRNRGIRIIKDFDGRVIRIGNVFLNYDFYGRIIRIGSIYLTYNHFALTRIGGLRIFYNHHAEIVWVSGSVNYGYGNNYNPCPRNYQYNDYQGDDDYSDDNDDDFYYYKKDGTKEKMDKEAIKAIKKEYKELQKETKKENKVFEKENK